MKLLLFVLFFLSTIVFAQENQIGILHGEDHVYTLQAPSGWILDNQSGVNQGLHAVFYEVGGAWGSSPVVMYTNVLIKKYEDIENSKDFLDYYIPSYESRFEGNKAKFLKPYISSSPDTLNIVHFFDNQYSNFENVCYINEDKTVVLVVIVAKSEELLNSNMKYFYQLIDSYNFITDDEEKFLLEFKNWQKTSEKR